MHYQRIAMIAALSVLLGATVPAVAGRNQERGRENPGKGEKHEGRPPQAEGHGQPRGGPPAEQGRGHQQVREQHHPPQPHPQGPPQRQMQQPHRQEQRAYQPPPQRSRQDAMAWQQNRGWLRQGGWQGHSNWQQTRARHWEVEHRSWAQRGGYGGYFIPADRYYVHFGPQHYFRIRTRPVLYMGYPRFEYGGFSFMIVDPWPEYWPETWYDQDDVYVDYDNGYYLYNRRYPRVRLAISVVL